MLIDRLFGSRLRGKVLGWFFTHVNERFFVRQLQSLLSKDPTNLSRELARLASLNILSSEIEGRQKYFKVNKACPFYEDMKGLVIKTLGVAGTIKTALERIQGVKYALLYGSFARNQEKPESDVDLLVIGNVNFDQLEDVLSDTEKQLGRTINITSYSSKEFHEKMNSKDSFVTTIFKAPKITLIGDEHEIRRS